MVLLRSLLSALATRQTLLLENLALRQQLAVLQRDSKRPRLIKADRVFWVLLSRIWNGWAGTLTLVKPETVIGWYCKGFRLYWRWKSRGAGRGRPAVAPEIRKLVRMMSQANPLWGAPRIHGELLKSGIEVSQPAVSKYMVRSGKGPLRAGEPSSATTSRNSSPSTSSRCLR
jgi:putative transposase